MMKNKFYLLLLCLFSINLVQAQSQLGEIRGKVIDAKTKKPLDFVNIIVELDGQFKGGTTSDLDGSYTIKSLRPGTYTIKATFIGYRNIMITDIVVQPDKIRFLNVEMQPSAVEIEEYVIVKSKIPIIDPEGKGGQTIGSKEIIKMPQRNLNSIANTVAGVVSVNGGTPNFRGARADGTAYYIDGVRVIGSFSLPQNAVDQISVITGGVPAQYGDYTGGAISVTTKGPSRTTQGAIELISSSPFDSYHYNEVQAFLRGPLIIKNRGDREKERSVLGYSAGGSFVFSQDRDPAAFGVWKLKDEKLAEIEQTPLQQAPIGVGFVPSAEFITRDDLENVSAKLNTPAYRINLTSNLNFQPTDNINIGFGGQVNLSNTTLYSFASSLLNFDNNPQRLDNTYRGFVRFTQTFKADENDEDGDEKKSLISDAFYQIRFDYTLRQITTQDEVHKDRLFDYGYIGKFDTYQAPSYTYFDAGVNGEARTFIVGGDTVRLARFWEQTGFADTLYTFERSEINPVRANYTSNYYDFTGAENVNNFNEVRTGLGLINGDNPIGIYSLMWTNAGNAQTNFSKAQVEQYTLFAMGEASVGRGTASKKHDLQFGLQYEQRIQRSYGISATGLWGLMRQLANNHILELDTDNPILVFDPSGSVFQDSVKYNRLVNREQQATFDSNLRSKLIASGATDVYGNPITDQTFIDVNSFRPDEYSLDMFTADELLNNGNSLVSYFGYDHLGNIVRGKPSLNEFFNSSSRTIGAFAPIYSAAWVQDKFAFKDLIFRVGVRVERYDANQKVLKDPFSFYPIRTAGEVRSTGRVGNSNVDASQIPSTIGDDFFVYVNDIENPSGLPVGYRNPENNVWYNAEGSVIADPTPLANAADGRIAPYLVDAQNQQLTVDGSFRDYEPQVNVLPRVYFSFPISTTAQFFTTYDVLTQRPPEGNILVVDDYFFINNRSNRILNNPDLVPTRRTDYELGFKQQIGNNAGLGIIASYSEMRNMVQQFRYNFAYPLTYTTFGNLDFATVKGFRVEFELRDAGNINFDANYSLQFADGTGSNSGSSAALIAAGQPNLRNLFPLSFDVRHVLKSKFDFHFKNGKEYNGPILNIGGKERPIFENAGANFIFNASSGRPYTQRSIATPEAQAGIVTRSPIKGSINGARLPWQFFTDVTVDKTFRVKLGKNKNDNPKYGQLVAYVWVQNLFNNKNIIGVYSFSGSANDDGYLNSPQGQQAITEATNAQSFVDLYNIKVANPNLFATPRLARLGFRLLF